MGVYITSFKITGVSPLLMNNPNCMGAGGKDGLGTKKVYDQQEEARIRVYRDESGAVYLPSESFRGSIIQACSGRKIGKVGAARVIRGAVFNTDTRVYLIDPSTGKPLDKFEVDIRRAIVNKQGILRARPMFPKWSCTLDLEIDGDFIADPEPVLQLLNIAGKTVGVGDFRPQRNGPFGRFGAEVLPATLKKKKAS